MTRYLLMISLVLSLVGCGDDDVGPVDSGSDRDTGGDTCGENGVQGDEVYGACTQRCTGSQITTADVCIRPPVVLPMTPDALDVNRVGCSQLESDGINERNERDDFCDEAAADARPNLSCMQAGMFRERGEVQMVTMYGVVDIFGNGTDADDILVEVYLEGPDGQLGTLVGSATAQIEDPCAEVDNVIEAGEIEQTRMIGFYSIPNVPTETPLIVKSSGASDLWRDIYSYNIQALNDEVETGAPPAGSCASIPTDARWNYRARIISGSDWRTIPLTAGLVDGVRPGSGALAGEVHDCDDIRLEYAYVGVQPEPVVLTYFNDNPTNPLPDNGREAGTSLLGLYGGLDIPAGPVRMAAIGRLDGENVTLGWYSARIFAGAVTTITLRGLRAQQVE
ncbi:MAG: hypothetical protein KF901_33060 [Myxococcales bacterium]|nr:hypothetical protein [Myxococcales bacterium]